MGRTVGTTCRLDERGVACLRGARGGRTIRVSGLGGAGPLGPPQADGALSFGRNPLRRGWPSGPALPEKRYNSV